MSEFIEKVDHDTKQLDNILKDLRDYYVSIKSKRQLGLDVPAGFRRESNHKQEFTMFSPPRKSSKLSSVLSENHSSSPLNKDQLVPSSFTIEDKPHLNLSQEQSTTTTSQDTDQPVQSHVVPLVRSIDKVSSSLPQKIHMNEDYLRACVGFRRVDTMKRFLGDLYQSTVTLDNTPADAVLDQGNFASIKKKHRNTTPVTRPQHFGDVMHIDIIFGPEVTVGNIHYGLLIVDRFSRMTYLQPLQNLTTDIQKQLETFFAHIGFIPRRIISDFDLKLIGGRARDYLNSMLVHVNAAPPHRQDKNGLAERHWQTLVSMSRNWLASAELPSTFWYYAVRRAAEVCNYFPLKLDDGSYITPFELAHNQKPDLRVLFKPFCLAAVRRERDGNKVLSKFDSQSLPMITIGRCPHSDGLQFYNPESGTFVSSIDYTFQHHVTAGCRFGYKYQAGTFIYRLDESSTIFSPKFPLDTKVLVHTHSPPHVAEIVGLPSYTKPDIYTVKFQDGSVAEYSVSENVLELAPVSTAPTSISNLLPYWIKGGCTATLFLENMPQPRHGRLYEEAEGSWVFCPGNKFLPSKVIPLSDLRANCQHLLDSGQLFKGQTKFDRVYQARQQVQLKNCVLRHISAHGLDSIIAPSSLKHFQTMSTNDKNIWKQAYDEEYDGLTSIPTWEVITEQEFKNLNKGIKPLPSMAIATIKYDAHNRLKRAKYRIVVLGNLDYHQWSKSATAAPVMSQLELRILTALAISHKRSLKNCDIKQAFVQSSLPSNEIYYVKPPVGCPRSKPNTYWRLIRSLYGLRRAPKLWYEKLRSHLHSMGLKCSNNSPCLFMGTLIDGEAPIYIGIYVDDIIYFSPSDAVEKKI